MSVAVSILGGSRSVSENDGLIQFTLLTTSPVPSDELVLVDFEILPGTATPKKDYEYSSPSAVFINQTEIYADRINIPGGASIGSFWVNILQDNLIEGNEDFTIKLVGVGPNAQIGDNASISVIILDDDVDTSAILYRVNAGGPEITATDGGPNWLADDPFLLNPYGTSLFSTSEAITLGDTLPATTPVEIFQTERFDPLCGVSYANMKYAFAVDPGIYEVRLYVANTFSGTSLPGERIFDVALENQIFPSLNNIDPSAKFGHLVGGLLSSTVEVTDGTLNVTFLHDFLEGIENPLVNGIEIIQLSKLDSLGEISPPSVSLVGEPGSVSEARGLTKVTLLTSEPVPSDENVTISFEIVPGSAIPLEDYEYESVTATFDPDTGLYRDTATLPSGFSASGILIKILQDDLTEDSETFTVNITDVDSYFEIGDNNSLPIIIEDSILNPGALRIEAEDTLYSDYQVENITVASGGQALKVSGNDPTSVSVSTITLDDLTGFTPGIYDVVISTFDQLFSNVSVGTSFRAELNGRVIGETPIADSSTHEIVDLSAALGQILAPGVYLESGDTLGVIGVESFSQPIWLDYIQLNPVGSVALGL